MPVHGHEDFSFTPSKTAEKSLARSWGAVADGLEGQIQCSAYLDDASRFKQARSVRSSVTTTFETLAMTDASHDSNVLNAMLPGVS